LLSQKLCLNVFLAVKGRTRECIFKTKHAFFLAWG
jgi:hypothetical protein